MIVVTYSSMYGASREYAECLAEHLGVRALDIKDADIAGASLFIHFGGLYAGTLAGLSKAVKLLPPDAVLVVVSVGLADPSKRENAEKIDSDIMRIVPEGIRPRLRIFRLRGRMDYSRLSPKHRAMMWMLRRWLERKTERGEESQAILDTYGTQIDFMDLASLDCIERFAEDYVD